MSSGKRHAQDSINLPIIVFPAMTWALYDVWGLYALLGGLIASVGCLSGILFSPDLDMEVRTLAERIPGFGWLWAVIWYPYALLIPHRSPLSHWPIIGALGRQLYFFFLVWVVGWLGGFNLTALLITHTIYSPFYWSWFVGLCVSDTAHWARDF